MDATSHPPSRRRWALLAVKIAIASTGVLLLGLLALVLEVSNEVGYPFKPGRMWGKVGDASLRYEYGHRWVPTPLVTSSQIATVHTHMRAKAAFRRLGGRADKIFDSARIKGHWRSAASYDYPIAGTGHLCDGHVVADEFEITVAKRTNTVVRTAQKPWRTVCRQEW